MSSPDLSVVSYDSVNTVLGKFSASSFSLLVSVSSAINVSSVVITTLSDSSNSEIFVVSSTNSSVLAPSV